MFKSVFNNLSTISFKFLFSTKNILNILIISCEANVIKNKKWLTEIDADLNIDTQDKSCLK